MPIQYLHTMLRVTDPDATVKFFNLLGLEEVRRYDSEKGRFSLIFLAAPGQKDVAEVELTHNWPAEDGSGEDYDGGRNFGHLAYRVENIYELCKTLMDAGVTINRPPRDGHMAFVRTPDNISVELLQAGDNLPVQEPWASMENIGEW
ncbi:VOC family protein [Sphingorhabdus sp. Alg231-15]|uniref:VOC family protein n=1 Tax=Sphingorhabdus sp. Alg231-15 TaxID=1922222 RepID=UPI000D559603